MKKLTLLFPFLLIISASLSGQVAGLEKPNVLFLVIDDLNDWVGFLGGHPQAETPNLDKLAKRGVAFTNAHCSAPQCSPSRASLLSGKDPEYTKIYIGNNYDNSVFRNNFSSTLGNETVYTLPEILKDSGGYYTTVINKIFHGKNYTTSVDIDFDAASSDPCARSKSWSETISLVGGDQVPADSADILGFEKFEWGQLDDDQEATMRDSRGLDEALNFLQQYGTSPGDFCNRPFFLGLGIFKPHLPLFVPAKYFPSYWQPDIYQVPYTIPFNQPANQFPPNGLIMPPQPDAMWSDYDRIPSLGQIFSREYNKNIHGAFIDYAQNLSPFPLIDPLITDTAELKFIASESNRAHSVLSYLAAIKYMDAQVGRLIDAMQAYPAVYNNTIIVVASDHGFGFGEKKHWRKVALWEKITRVPMIIIDPRKPGNRVCNTPVSLLDLFPTVLEMTNTPEPEFSDGSRYLDGQSLVTLLDNPGDEWERPVLTSAKLPLGYPDGGCFGQYALRTEKYRYIYYQTNNAASDPGYCDLGGSQVQEELYEIGENREVDPNEWNNLAGQAEYGLLKKYLQQWLPGGPLYMQKGGKVQVEYDSIDCAFDASSVTNFTSSLYDASGSLITSPGAAYSYCWTSNVFADTLTSAGFTLDGSTLDPVLLGSLDTIFVHLEVKDTSGLLYYDLKTINAALTPSSFFLVSLPQPNVANIHSFSPASNIVKSSWDYGDGYTSNEALPGPHAYSSPGNYVISHKVFYGSDPDKLCESRTDLALFIPNSVFDVMPCGTTQWIDNIYTTANRINPLWGEVYNANNYEIRARPQTLIGEGGWYFLNSSSSDVLINGLDFGTTYSVQVRATCAPGDTGQWSYPATFSTEPCLAPRAVDVRDITTDAATIYWDTVNTSGNFQFIYKKPGIVTLIKGNFAGVDSVPLTGLLENKKYFYALRQYCQQIDGNYSIRGDLTEIFDFRTSSARQGSIVTEEITLDVFPNPSSDQINLLFQGKSSGQATISLTDAFGRLMLESTWQLAGAGSETSISLESLATGTYFLNMETPEGVSVRRKVLVQR